MKTRFLSLLLVWMMALTCCLPVALADAGVSNELNVPIAPKGIVVDETSDGLTLSIKLSPSTVLPGGTVGVTVTLTNNGEDGEEPVTGLTLGCSLPPNVTSAHSIPWLGELASKESTELKFGVTFPGDTAVGIYDFTASVTGNSIEKLTAKASATVVGAEDIALSIAADNTTPKQGGSVTYTIELTNGSETEANGLELQCQVTNGMTVSETGGGALSNGMISWDVNVPGKGTVTRSFTGTIPSAATIGAQYTAAASVPELGLSQSATATVTNYVLSLSIGADAYWVRAGEAVRFTATLQNTGNLGAGTVQLTSDVPSGMSVGGISDGGTHSGNQITWTIEPGANTTFTRSFTGTIPSSAAAGAVYKVTSITTGDGISLSDYASVEVYDDKPDLRIKKTVNNRTPEPGASVRYTITVTNRGGADADDVTIIDTLPWELEVIESSISDGGDYQGGRDRIVWTVDVPKGDEVRLTFRAWVPDDAEDGDAYVNRARIEDGGGARVTIVVTEDAVPKTGEVIVPAAWWKKAAPTPAPTAPTEDADAADEPLPPVQQAFAELYAQNADLIGRLNVPGLVDLPVVQAKDNDFYMQHNFDGREEQAGALFLDERNAVYPADQHLLIYGHNMKSGAMFGQLSKYRSLDYLRSNPVLSFQSIYDAEPTYYVAVAVLDASMNAGHTDYLKIRRPNFNDGDDGKAFLEAVQTFSYFDIPVDVDETDPLLTLVTCSYFQDNGRLLVVARPLREGEVYEDVVALMAGSAANPARASRA